MLAPDVPRFEYRTRWGNGGLLVPPQFAACVRARRYQGVDWRDRRFHACNHRVSPINTRSAYDGIDIDPLEVMFIKYKDSWEVAGEQS